MSRFAIALVGLLLWGPAVAAGAAPTTSFEQSLQQADRIRSSAPEQFQSSLRALEARRSEASPLQRQRLEYLRIYAMAVYGNDRKGAIAAATELLGEATDVDLRFRTGSLIANIHTISRNFGEGLRYLDLTLPNRGRVQDRNIRHDGLTTAAGFYSDLGQHRLALQYAQETLADKPGPRARCIADYRQLKAMYALQQLPAHDGVMIQAIDRCTRQGENIPANMIRFLLARHWAATGHSGKAVALVQNHLAEVEGTGYWWLLGESHSLLAQLLLADNDVAGAEMHAKTVIEKGAGPITYPQVMAHMVMYEIAERRGDLASALSHYRMYAEADKAYFNELKSRELVYQVAKQESARKTRQIWLLDQQGQVLQLQHRAQRQSSQNLGLLAALLGSLLAGLGYWAYRIKRMHGSLRRIAQTDGLTGISNRHHFTQQAKRSLSQCARAGESAAVIMIDLDRFKAINDTYGHEAGDWVLKQVAATCAGLCRRIDHFGRIGGEEFAILLHGCELKSAARLAEDCRVRLSEIETRPSGHTFPVTASFGVSATAQSGYGLAELMSHADLMLYRAKREGRNRVRSYTGDLPDASPPATPIGLPRAVDDAAETVDPGRSPSRRPT